MVTRSLPEPFFPETGPHDGYKYVDSFVGWTRVTEQDKDTLWNPPRQKPGGPGGVLNTFSGSFSASANSVSKTQGIPPQAHPPGARPLDQSAESQRIYLSLLNLRLGHFWWWLLLGLAQGLPPSRSPGLSMAPRIEPRLAVCHPHNRVTSAIFSLQPGHCIARQLPGFTAVSPVSLWNAVRPNPK